MCKNTHFPYARYTLNRLVDRVKRNVFILLVNDNFLSIIRYGVALTETTLFSLANAIKLIAFLSQHGLHGEIRFSHLQNESIQVQTSLETTLQYPNQVWSWAVHQLPVDFTDPNGDRRCRPATLGAQILSFDESLGHLTLPGNESATYTLAADITGISFSHLRTEPSTEIPRETDR